MLSVTYDIFGVIYKNVYLCTIIKFVIGVSIHIELCTRGNLLRSRSTNTTKLLSLSLPISITSIGSALPTRLDPSP